MIDKVDHNCGIAAVFIRGNMDKYKSLYPNVDEEYAMPLMYKLLLNLQNRGQLSAGVASYSADREKLLKTYRNIGQVNEVFKMNSTGKRKRLFKAYSGQKMIGHVRYATCGKDDRSYAQPFERAHGRRWKWFTFAFNGNIANYNELKNKLLDKKEDYHITRDTDTEIIMHYIARELKGDKKPDLVKVFSSLSEIFDGAWSLVFMNGDGDVVVARDKLGIRPLCYSISDDLVVAASESSALVNAGISNFKHLKPGEMLLIEGEKAEVKQFAKSSFTARCMFEWVYFANVATNIDDKSVYMVRKRLGEELAKLETQKIDDDFIVVPVPDTARASADSFAYSLGVMSIEGLLRNRYLGRTFIEGESRDDKVRSKFTPMPEIMEGKKVLLVDDSIVRGTTLKKLIQYIRKVGKPSEIHVRVSCPPILGPCFYGIDMSTVSELFAPNYVKSASGLVNGALPDEVLDKMAKDIGADTLIYQTIPGLLKAIGMGDKELCLACLDNKYPTKYGDKLYQIAISDSKNGSSKRRTHEKSC
jgi:amidophosphoribosyltransferase